MTAARACRQRVSNPPPAAAPFGSRSAFAGAAPRMHRICRAGACTHDPGINVARGPPGDKAGGRLRPCAPPLRGAVLSARGAAQPPSRPRVDWRRAAAAPFRRPTLSGPVYIGRCHLYKSRTPAGTAANMLSALFLALALVLAAACPAALALDVIDVPYSPSVWAVDISARGARYSPFL